MNFKNIFETSEVSKWKYLNLWAKEIGSIFLSSLSFSVVSGICFLLSLVHTLSFKNSRSCHYFLLPNPNASQTSILLSYIGFSEQVAWRATCNVGDLGSIPGSGRSPGGGHGNPLHYSLPENPHGQRSQEPRSLGPQRVGWGWETSRAQPETRCAIAEWRAYLRTLPSWDGAPRWDGCLSVLFTVVPTALRTVAHTWYVLNESLLTEQ